MENTKNIWKITGFDYHINFNLPTLYIKASSFDTALEKARTFNECYTTGQIIEILTD